MKFLLALRVSIFPFLLFLVLFCDIKFRRDIWSKAYSQSISRSGSIRAEKGTLLAQTAWDLRQSFKHIAPGKKVCFKDFTIGIFGPAGENYRCVI